MDLAFVPPLYPPKGNRAIYEVKPFSSALHRNLYSQRTSPCLATAATQTSECGGWRLQYTSAPDVLKKFSSIMLFDGVFQPRQSNVYEISHMGLLQLEQEGATLLVSAKFDIVSVRNIYLQFEEISQNIWQHTFELIVHEEQDLQSATID
ncbi:putative plastid-lipid-associated protein 10 [Quercus suber]|uniref:Plastid-lipid-associated protein 10 n=1 Tax=Quercus suber TaxID=58331 RepID=A0AAW0LZL7_QUESU